MREATGGIRHLHKNARRSPSHMEKPSPLFRFLVVRSNLGSFSFLFLFSTVFTIATRSFDTMLASPAFLARCFLLQSAVLSLASPLLDERGNSHHLKCTNAPTVVAG